MHAMTGSHAPGNQRQPRETVRRRPGEALLAVLAVSATLAQAAAAQPASQPAVAPPAVAQTTASQPADAGAGAAQQASARVLALPARATAAVPESLPQASAAASSAAPSAASAPAVPQGASAGAEAFASGSVQFVGTATVLIRYAGLTVLTDPNFLHRGDHVHLGYGLTSRRLTEPALTLDQLPPIDLVLLSHFHGDHFDQLVQKRMNRAMPIVAPPAAARMLRRIGFTAVTPIDRWQAVDVTKDGTPRLRITAMPGRHGPPVVNRALPPVMGSMLDFRAAPGGSGALAWRMYVSGDTTMFRDLQEIPRRYPGVDLALLHLGGTRVGGVLVTMDAKQGVEMLRLVNPARAVPIHYDDYTVFKSPLADFVAAARQAGWEDRLTLLKRGDTHEFRPPAERLR